MRLVVFPSFLVRHSILLLLPFYRFLPTEEMLVRGSSTIPCTPRHPHFTPQSLFPFLVL